MKRTPASSLALIAAFASVVVACGGSFEMRPDAEAAAPGGDEAGTGGTGSLGGSGGAGGTGGGGVTGSGGSLPLGTGGAPVCSPSRDAGPVGTEDGSEAGVEVDASGGEVAEAQDADPDAEVGDDMHSGDPAGPNTLVVVGALPTGSYGQLLSQLPASLWLAMWDDVHVSETDAIGKRLIIITPAARAFALGDRLRNVSVPVIVMQPDLFPPMQMTGDCPGDHGQIPTTRQIEMASPPAPFGGFLSGVVTVYTAPAPLGFGRPGVGALAVARTVGNPAQATIFAYPAGAEMVGAKAPGRRIGFFADRPDETSDLSPEGYQLLNAAVEWALAP